MNPSLKYKDQLAGAEQHKRSPVLKQRNMCRTSDKAAGRSLKEIVKRRITRSQIDHDKASVVAATRNTGHALTKPISHEQHHDANVNASGIERPSAPDVIVKKNKKKTVKKEAPTLGKKAPPSAKASHQPKASPRPLPASHLYAAAPLKTSPQPTPTLAYHPYQASAPLSEWSSLERDANDSPALYLPRVSKPYRIANSTSKYPSTDVDDSMQIDQKENSTFVQQHPSLACGIDSSKSIVKASPDAAPVEVCRIEDDPNSVAIRHPNGTVIVISSMAVDVGSMFESGIFEATSACSGEPSESDTSPTVISASDTSVSSMSTSDRNGASVASLEPRKFRRWTETEDTLLLKAVDEYGGGKNGKINWMRISRKYFKGIRSSRQCKNRWCKHVNPALKRAPFTKEEDRIVTQGVNDKMKWIDIAQLLEGRTSECVRQRWTNKLDPTLKSGPFSDSENEILFQAQGRLGNQWKKISMLLPGRSENQVKNRWHNAQMSVRRKLVRIANETEAARELEEARSHATAPPQDTKSSPEMTILSDVTTEV